MKRPFDFVSLPFRRLIAILLAVDFGFIGLNMAAFILAKTGVIDHVPLALKITEDRALPEDFNYAKWFVIVAALLWLAVRDRWLAPLAWALVFAMILADDSFQFHEIFGDRLATEMSLTSNSVLNGQDFGELFVFLGMAAIALMLTLALLVGRGEWSRILSVRYLIVLAALGFFGVGIDALHQVVTHLADGVDFVTLLPPFFGMIEDGGEMLVASVAVALTLAPPAAFPAERRARRYDVRPAQSNDT